MAASLRVMGAPSGLTTNPDAGLATVIPIRRNSRAAPRACPRSAARTSARATAAGPVPWVPGFRDDLLPMSLKGKTMFISGGSRGIGLQIALKSAEGDGANVALIAKTAEPHPKLPGHRLHGGGGDRGRGRHGAADRRRHPRRRPGSKRRSSETVERFGGIDLLVNNASAINLSKTEDLPVRRFDLMQEINARGTFVVTPRVHPAPQAGHQRAHPDALGRRSRSSRAWLGGPHRLHALQVRHEPARARVSPRNCARPAGSRPTPSGRAP